MKAAPFVEYKVSLTPDSESGEVSVIPTGEEYQPFLYVPAGAAPRTGRVLSIFMLTIVMLF